MGGIRRTEKIDLSSLPPLRNGDSISFTMADDGEIALIALNRVEATPSLRGRARRLAAEAKAIGFHRTSAVAVPPEAQDAVMELLHELHQALYGYTCARDATPKEVFEEILSVIRLLSERSK